MDIQTSYEIMGLEPGTPPAEVKQCYRDLVNVWHPDRFANNPRLQKKAEEQLKAINAAYAVLKDVRPEQTDSGFRQGESGHRREKTGKEKPSVSPEKNAAEIFSMLRKQMRKYGKTVIFSACAGCTCTVLLILLHYALTISVSGPDTFGPGEENTGLETSGDFSPGMETETEQEKPEISYSITDAWLADLKKRIAWEKIQKKKQDAEDIPPPAALQTKAEESELPDGEGEKDIPGESLVDMFGDFDDADKKRMRALGNPQRGSPGGKEKKETAARNHTAAAVPENRDAFLLKKNGERIRRYRAEIRQELRQCGKRFRVLKDGNVLDTQTGLMWCMLNSFQEKGCYLSYEKALRYVKNLQTGGYRDWRIPTSSELAEIYIHEPVFPDIGAAWFWTSETYSRGWNRIARVFRPGKRTRIRKEYAKLYEKGVVHAVRTP